VITFYFDLGSPYAYLAAERMARLLPEPVHWQPVLLGGLFKLANRRSWALGDERRRSTGMAEIERRARAYGLAPMRWPDPWPDDYLTAMRVATYAFTAGRGRGFAIQAYRDSFTTGLDLSIADNVIASAGRAGLDPAAARAGAHDPEIKHALRAATDAAYDLGVFGVPTIAIGAELFWGDDRLEDAALHLERATA
jgi:2-hydroxychromene-2-carboxylate isomerase